MSGDLKWWDGENAKESTVVPSVQAVAVYTNTEGNVVIRQQDFYGEDDHIIVLPRTMVAKVAEAMKREAKNAA